MKYLVGFTALLFPALFIFMGCEQACNACLELTVKEIKYVDANGENLLFGPKAIYDPDRVVVRAEVDYLVDVWRQQTTGTIQFNLESDYTTYYISLTNTIVDTLHFELDERESENCCGNVVYSTKTFLNGLEIENSDLIIISR